MGKFAEAAAQFEVDKRGDGFCVTGRWIAGNLDDEDIAEFIRLSNGHNWQQIVRLSDNALREKSLKTHVHGECSCIEGVAGKGCCSCLSGKKSA